ncbi:Cytochrome c oxidase subunit CcoO [hydrothermal vent metagenome]|uniref:Cytochrome c oxidase subunit CcoO n=1 Tax=hydrothermal vent metagenome TaxID=652676 RepID=A0A3B1BPH0_9ZZZZ
MSTELFQNARYLRPFPLILFLLVSGVFSFRPAFAVKANTPQTSNSGTRVHEQGRKIYNFRCYYCHGYSGNAQTLSSRFLNPPPRDFTRLQPQSLSRKSMIASVRNGHPGTAMASYANILTPHQIALVVDFVRNEFILHKKENTRYHTAANGWPRHERYRAAFPFALGKIPLDRNPETLSPEQLKGRQLFLDTCITCHDRANVENEGPEWEASAVSFPRNNTSFSYPQVDNISEASVYARHEVPPVVASLDKKEKRGAQLFRANCAFCHGADGTGKNWIGSFLEPRPRDLTDPKIMQAMTVQRLRHAIEYGLTDTTMPAWKDVLKKKEIDALIAYINAAFYPLSHDSKQ